MGGRHSHSGQAAFCGIEHDGRGEKLSTRHPRLGNGVLSPTGLNFPGWEVPWGLSWVGESAEGVEREGGRRQWGWLVGVGGEGGGGRLKMDR